MHSFVSPLVRDLSDWSPETRLKSIQVLHCLILHAESKATIQLSTIIDGIVSAAKDENKKISQIVRELLKKRKKLIYFKKSYIYL